MWIHHLDNQMCAADNNDPTTALDGANIKIHKGEGQATCKECEWSELGSRSTAISGASKENPRILLANPGLRMIVHFLGLGTDAASG